MLTLGSYALRQRSLVNARYSSMLGTVVLWSAAELDRLLSRCLTRLSKLYQRGFISCALQTSSAIPVRIGYVEPSASLVYLTKGIESSLPNGTCMNNQTFVYIHT